MKEQSDQNIPVVPQRISFDQEEPSQPKVHKGSKVDVSKSRFAKNARAKEQFESKAAKTHDTLEGNQVKAVQLGQEFISFFNKKVLPENKGPLEKSFEREIIGKLVQFAIDINNDEAEPQDGMGSVSMITLLLNTIIKLRDRCNLLEYKIRHLEDKTTKLVEKASEPDVE